MAHTPSESNFELVERMAGFGITHEQIAAFLGISADTLKKYYEKQLREGRVKANVNVAGALYKNAMIGNVTAQIFWLKTRAGWRETDAAESAEIRIESVTYVVQPKPNK